MLTPSSNTILEPVTAAMLAATPQVSAHFARLRVRAISLEAEHLGQFDFTPMLDAASLLADAKVDAIVWNGTSGSWMGPARDRALCAEIKRLHAIPAGTTTLGMLEAFGRANVRTYGLVTPYTADVQERISSTLDREGFRCVAERHAGIRDNYAFADLAPAFVIRSTREIAALKPDAIVILCTNVRAAGLARDLERDLDIPVLDSVALSLWSAMRLAKVSPALIKGWGRVFEL